MWNPLRSYFEYRSRRDDAAARVAAAERAERAEERAAYLAAVQSMTTLAASAFDANRAQSSAFQAFLDGFRTTSAPVARPYDEQAEVDRYLAGRASAAGTPALPASLAGLDRLASFEQLLDDMDKM